MRQALVVVALLAGTVSALAQGQRFRYAEPIRPNAPYDGKFTFANLLPRFYAPTSGRILLDGHDIQALTLDSLRANIALVSQDVVLFNDARLRRTAPTLFPGIRDSRRPDRGIGIKGDQSVNDLLTLSQVILGIQLPLAMFPLLHFTSSRRRMGSYANGWFLLLAGWLLLRPRTALSVDGWLRADPDTGWGGAGYPAG